MASSALSPASQAKRIAVFRPCGLGDAAQVSPLFQQIHSDCPDADIHFFTNEGIPSLFDGAPYLKECHVFSTATLLSKAVEWGGAPIWREIGRLGPWDFLLNLDFQFKRALLLPLARSRVTAGLQSIRRRAYSPYDHVIRLNPHDPENLGHGHTSLTYLNLWEKASGFTDSGFGYDLRHLLRLKTPPLPSELPARFICLAPGTGNIFSRVSTKQWPIEHWRELAHLLVDSGHEVVWIGTEDELATFGAPPVGQNLMGKLNLIQLAHVLAASTLCIAHDSGPFHLALAVGARALGIYGPTSSMRLGPFRTSLGRAVHAPLPCVPCGRGVCLVQLPDRADGARPYCMTGLPPASLLSHATAFLEPPAGAR